MGESHSARKVRTLGCLSVFNRFTADLSIVMGIITTSVFSFSTAMQEKNCHLATSSWVVEAPDFVSQTKIDATSPDARCLPVCNRHTDLLEYTEF